METFPLFLMAELAVFELISCIGHKLSDQGAAASNI